LKKKKFSLKSANKAIVAVGFTLLICASALLFFMTEEKSTTSVFNKNENTFGSVEFVVVDGFSEEPLKQAKVVIIETGEIYYTDEFGKTPKVLVPIIRDRRYDKIIPKPWGEISVIIYKEEYLEYALFYLQVFEGETREGIKILMFKQEDASSANPFSIIEGPNRLWVNELINIYQKVE
jgi:hypothetical protein